MRFCAAVPFAAVIFLTSCGTTSASIGPNGRPSVLRYCFTVSGLDPGPANHRLELTRRYLERELHLKVEVVKTTAYGAVIEAFRAKKIDVASISPFAYILATQKARVEAIAMRGSRDGTPGDYSGVIAVPGDSPIRSIDDLLQHSRELTISFVDPASSSGFLVENAFLQSKGIEPLRDFKKVVFSMTHPASLLALKAGKVDAAATMLRLIKRYEETGKLAKGDVRVLWVSPNIPNQPIAVRKDLPQDLKEDIRRAFLDMPRKDPEAWISQTTGSSAAPTGEAYVSANDSMFDGLREVARDVKDLSLLDR